MQKTDILKNKNIFITIFLLFFLFVAYRYSILNLKAANFYSCNYYSGRCLIDNSFGKSNNLETCNVDCLKKRYKYYFNNLVNTCVLDFRGTYDSKEQCDEANVKNMTYVGDEYGCSVANYESSKYMPMLLGTDRESCLKNIRPIGRVYECNVTNKKCDLVDKTDDNAKLTYEGCWTNCMEQDVNKLPKETLYGCSIAGFCYPNPSGGFKTYEECYNNSTCKAKRLVYEEKTNIRYKWDETLKKCVKDDKGQFENWRECRAVKQGIGSEIIYTCDTVRKQCLEKTWKDFLNLTVIAGKTGCYSSDCMNMGQGTHVEYRMPEMFCDIDDTCLLNPESPKSLQNIIYLTLESCQKYCGKVDKKSVVSDNACYNDLEERLDSCYSQSDCTIKNDVCAKDHSVDHFSGWIEKKTCEENGWIWLGTYKEDSVTCTCVNGKCRAWGKTDPICGDKKCEPLEKYPYFHGSNSGPLRNNYCPQDCK